jgi:integrase
MLIIYTFEVYNKIFQQMSTSTDFKVRLMIFNRTNKQGQTKVLVEVMRYIYAATGKERKYVDSLVSISPKNWQQKTQKISNKEPDQTTKQTQINQAYSAVLAFVSTSGEQYPSVDGLNLDNLKPFFPKMKIHRKTFADYIKDYYDLRVNQNTKKGTTKEFKTLQNRIEAFDTHSKKKTYFEDINILWSNQFESYCRNTKKYSDGTIGKCYTLIFTVLNYYYQLRDEMQVGLTDKFTYDGFRRGTKSINEANPLTMLQLMTLYNHQFEDEHLTATKKMILIQCFTGVRFDDIKRLRPQNFENDGFLKFKPMKTEHHKKIEVLQPLNEYAKGLLSEVGYDTSVYKLQNQPYNRNIKDIFDILRLKYPDLKYKTYTSHNFRDTFISNAVQASINWKSILKWVGQTSYQIMDRYIHLTPEFEKNEMQKMFKYMVVQGKVVYYKE